MKWVNTLKGTTGVLQLSESLALKAVSLLLALILWITILGFKKEELKKKVRFAPKVAPSMVITNRPPPTIEFLFSGPRFSLNTLEKRDLAIEPDLTRSRETTIPIPITEDLIGDLPRGIRVVRFYPPNLLVRLEDLVESVVSVKAVLKGSPARGFEVTKVVVSPRKVTVSGPRSFLQAMELIQTEPFDIEGIQDTKEGTVAVDIDKTVELRLPKETVVSLRVFIRPRVRRP